MPASIQRFQGVNWTTKHHRMAMHAGEAGAAAGIGFLVAGLTLAMFMGKGAAIWAVALILLGPLVVYLSIIVTASYLEKIEPAKYVREA